MQSSFNFVNRERSGNDSNGLPAIYTQQSDSFKKDGSWNQGTTHERLHRNFRDSPTTQRNRVTEHDFVRGAGNVTQSIEADSTAIQPTDCDTTLCREKNSSSYKNMHTKNLFVRWVFAVSSPSRCFPVKSEVDSQTSIVTSMKKSLSCCTFASIDMRRPTNNRNQCKCKCKKKNQFFTSKDSRFAHSDKLIGRTCATPCKKSSRTVERRRNGTSASSWVLPSHNELNDGGNKFVSIGSVSSFLSRYSMRSCVKRERFGNVWILFFERLRRRNAVAHSSPSGVVVSWFSANEKSFSIGKWRIDGATSSWQALRSMSHNRRSRSNPTGGAPIGQ